LVLTEGACLVLRNPKSKIGCPYYDEWLTIGIDANPEVLKVAMRTYERRYKIPRNYLVTSSLGRALEYTKKTDMSREKITRGLEGTISDAIRTVLTS